MKTSSDISSSSDYFDGDADLEYTLENDEPYSPESCSSNENEAPDTPQPIPVNESRVDQLQVADQSKLKILTYNPNSQEVGINPDLIETMSSLTPYEFFVLF